MENDMDNRIREALAKYLADFIEAHAESGAWDGALRDVDARTAAWMAEAAFAVLSAGEGSEAQVT
jgi:hypothetical protein